MTTMAASGMHTEDTPETQDAWERGYAQGWSGGSNFARPPISFVPVRATWGELGVGRIVLDTSGGHWIITRHEAIPGGLAVTIVGGPHGQTHSWPNTTNPTPRDPSERVWLLEDVALAEAHAIVGQQIGHYVKTRIVALPPAAGT